MLGSRRFSGVAQAPFDFGNSVVLRGLPRIDYREPTTRNRVSFATGPRVGLSIGFSPCRSIFFSIRNGRYSGASGRGFDLTDKNAAWAEMTSVCGDLVGSISRNLKQN